MKFIDTDLIIEAHTEINRVIAFCGLRPTIFALLRLKWAGLGAWGSDLPVISSMGA